MNTRRLTFVVVAACALGFLAAAPADRLRPEDRSQNRPRPAVSTPQPAQDMPEDLRASVPQRGPSLPRPEVVRGLRRQS